MEGDCQSWKESVVEGIPPSQTTPWVAFRCVRLKSDFSRSGRRRQKARGEESSEGLDSSDSTGVGQVPLHAVIDSCGPGRCGVSEPVRLTREFSCVKPIFRERNSRSRKI